MTPWRIRSAASAVRVMASLLFLAVLCPSLSGASGADVAPAPLTRLVAPGVWLVAGEVRPDRQPDGNTVVFEAPQGLIVVDTGRHDWHRAAILALAAERRQPVIAIVNTHWHLDHVSGNPGLRAAFPGLQVHGSNAIDGALSGFLTRSARDSAAYLEDLRIPAAMREDIQGDLDTIRNGDALRPDVVIAGSGAVEIGGRTLQVYRAGNAVTAGDLWLYDPGLRLAVLGDLVTLPAPYLDTACPEGWSRALEEVADTPFEQAIPGHGPPQTRAEFERWRGAFDGFIDCAASDAAVAECANRWVDAVTPLLAATDVPTAHQLAEYYAGMLRANGGRSPDCAADRAR